MNSAISALRKRFLDPPLDYRHLTIMHTFWHRKDLADPLPEDFESRIATRLKRIMDWGFGGVVANVGSTDYLENEQEWQAFVTGFRAAKNLGMRVWIYDEDGYPSGAAGGVVLRDHPEHEAQSMLRMRESFDAGEVRMRPPTGWWYGVRARAVFDDGQAEDVTERIDSDGFLRFDAPRPCTVTRFDVRRAFEGTHCTCNVFRARRYINVLDRAAVRCFFDVTEGRYFDRMGDDASYVEAIFTDEPSFMSAYHVPLTEEWKQKIPVQDPYEEVFDQLPMIAWDRDLPAKFSARWGYDLLCELDRLFEGCSERDMRVRHDFYQLLSEIYADTFFGMQQDLLNDRRIAFSGHALCEESLTMHVACEGSLMADLKCMQIPGIDMLSSIPENIYDSLRLLSCKYGSSAAHVMGREQVMSESSDFDERVAGSPVTLEQRRGAFALQMALGVTTLTSYYTWRDFDADERKKTLDFWARLATIVREGVHKTDFALLYPVRTAWAHYKPTDRVVSSQDMDEPLRSMDDHLLRIAHSLLRQGLDFDFIDTRDLIGCDVRAGEIRIGRESYSTLIVPPGAVMCPEDLRRTRESVDAGGTLIAFEPLSQFALAGPSPEQVIRELAAGTPERVRVVKTIDEFADAARSAASQDIKIRLRGDYMVARRSVYDGSDFVLIVNAAGAAAAASVEFEQGRTAEVWDPWDTRILEVGSHIVSLEVPEYSARVVVSQRRQA